MSENERNINLLISPRFVRVENGIRPFQRSLFEAIFNRNEKIIILEAPVGAGKTYTIRKLLEKRTFKREPLVLIYPTKILMEAQINSFKQELLDEVKIWPWESFDDRKINIFVYSTDTLLEAIKNKKIQNLTDRGDLIYKLFTDLEWFSKYGAIATSPDVLYLLIHGRYKNSHRILNFLQNSLFVFDEFHCYYGLQTFSELLDYLLSKIAGKVILLSATPLKTEAFEDLEEKYGSYNISFAESIGDVFDICFNFSLDMQIYSFRFTKLDETAKRLNKLIPELPKPCAVIFDSIFRLKHIARRININDFNCKEWSGMKKERGLLIDDKTVILATSAIEVGIDMKFKSLIFEASYWPSAIQRLGRVGRKEEGIAVMFTRKDFKPYLENRDKIERSEFEKILMEILNTPKEEIGDGYSFRGESFNFILVDNNLDETFVYNENLFAMYDITEYIDDWRLLKRGNKRQKLEEFGVPQEKIEDILLIDRVIPFWGLLRGTLRDEYEYISSSDIKCPTSDRNELVIKSMVFYGE